VPVSSLPPPTRPVDCMNYSSICNKQLGNYYCHHQINNSPCDAATTKPFNLSQREQGRLYVAEHHYSFFILLLQCFAVSPPLYFFSLSLFTLAFFVPPSLVSLSRTFMKGELLWGRESGPGSIALCFSASGFLLLLFLSDPVFVETSSLLQSDWICILCVCVCVCVCVWVLCSCCLFRKLLWRKNNAEKYARFMKL